MKIRIFPLLIAVTSSNLFADPVPQPQIVLSPATASTMDADWDGVIGRTYFFSM